MNATPQLKMYLIGALSIIGSMGSASAALITNAPMAITDAITVQPIIVSDDDGNNTATFFGDTTQQSSIEGSIDTIWAQAGIDVNFLAPNLWDNTDANSDLAAIFTTVSDGADAGVTNVDPNVINIFFINRTDPFSVPNQSLVSGIGIIAGNGITQFVGSNLLGTTSGQEIVALVVAHEIGHNLGLIHLEESENLMQANVSAADARLNSSQISTALASNLSSPTVVPIPPAAWLFGSGLIGLVGMARRKAA